MERFRKVAVSGLTLIALGVALVLAPIAARADEQVPGSAVGGATQNIAQAQDQADGLVPAGPSGANPINFHDANLDVRGDQ